MRAGFLVETGMDEHARQGAWRDSEALGLASQGLVVDLVEPRTVIALVMSPITQRVMATPRLPPPAGFTPGCTLHSAGIESASPVSPMLSTRTPRTRTTRCG